ncbi:MAG: polyphosphate kinase 1 [Bdellovibrionales bacterium]|nr:polyphosphate kinase 1 [Bdellovibrionales bacterium]
MSEKDLFLNRDLSWLEFNARVLHEALDDRTPLFERVKFLGIFQSNLDEYFMKRMGSLYSQARVRFREQLLPLLWETHRSFEADILPALKTEGIDLVHWSELTEEEQTRANNYYQTNLFPILTPLAVDSGHPFPFLSNLSISLGVLLKHPERDDEFFSRVKIPTHFPGWIRIDGNTDKKKARFISIIEIILTNLQPVFQGMEILEIMPFRVTRNTSIEHDEDDTDDLMDIISEELKERRFGDVVRLEYWGKPNQRMLELLREELHLDEDQIYEVNGLFEYSSLKPVWELNRPDLKFEPWIPVAPASLADPERDMFQLIKQHDILVHHPYDSFSASVERFIRNAVNDPKVIAIKMTLYRVGADSPLVPLLIHAAEMGKHVVCLVELKARFDEEKNILVAQKLEEAGVHVVYGVLGLKTHCKTTLVVRQEGDEVKSYVHIGSGNYHSITSRLYTDLGLFTCKKDISDDVVHLFHYLTGRSLKKDYKKLLVAPLTMKDTFLRKISREITNAKKGLPARIIAKVNSLDERDVSQALAEASQAGVKVDLIVRGFCCLRPGVKGLSENIRVVSILGRFLEHSRIFYFQNGEKESIKGEFYMGSADLMYRNLSARVEAIAPIEEIQHRERIFDILTYMLQDQRQGWEMNSDGTYSRTKVKNPKKEIGTHAYLMQKARNRA